MAGHLQAKLRVGPQNDAYEREADSVAARVMDGPGMAPETGHAEDAMQRKCCGDCADEDAQRMPLLQRQEAEQEEDALQMKQRVDIQRQQEEEEELQAKRLDGNLQRQTGAGEDEEEEMIQSKAKADGSFTASGAVSAQVAGLKGGGQGLSTSARAYFEPRFGADFSDVRIHTGARADAAAKALNARAFTTGRDVVFGDGEFAPHTRKGGELLAHELTHVLQQRSDRRGDRGLDAQRWKIGTAPVPAAFPSGKLVPQGRPAGTADHRKRLKEARAIVARLLSSTRCVNYFKDKCDSGTASSLKDTFNKVNVYFMDVGGTLFAATPTGSNDIGYNRTTYEQGKWFLASSLLHEMYHVCAPAATAHDREWNAENAVETCRLYTPFLQDISPASGPVGGTVTIRGWNFGPTQGAHDRVELNGLSCPITSWTFDRSASRVTITVTIPAGAKSGSLRVINNTVTSRPAKFTVT